MAVLALAARFFDSQTWADISVPSEEAAQGKSSLSRMSLTLTTSVEVNIAGLNQVVLAYLCATTQDLKSGSGLPVLLNGPARGGGPTKHIGESTTSKQANS
jgi:nuclear pore complex protein Nup205